MIKNSFLKKLLNITAVLTLMFGVAQLQYFNSVTTVYAQESEPVPEESTTSESSTGDSTAPEDSADTGAETASEDDGSVSTEDSMQTEEVAVEDQASQSDEEVAADAPEEETSSDEDLSEVVLVLAETESVLVDENGNVISLASVDAADALVVSDPYFTRNGTKYCYVPTGETPHPSLGCDVWDDVDYPIQAAIDDVELNGLPVDRKIIVEPGTYVENVVININGLILYGDPGKETEDGADSGAPVLDGSTINGTGITIYGDSTHIIGFILRNFDTGISVIDAGDVLIKDNTLEDNKVGIKINNSSGSSKKVEIYGNVVKSSQTDSVGLNVISAGPNSIYASLNSFLNEDLNVKDESGQEDFELFFNEWGYWDGGSYVVCSLSGHTEADYLGLYECSNVENVLASEMLLDGSLYPYVFSQDITKHGEFCIDEKNSNYAVKTESGPGPLTLTAGESFSFVAVKQATGCYYQMAPIEDGPENGVYMDVNGVQQCIFVTRSTDPTTGEHSYTFEVASEGGGCGISHVVGYFDPAIDQEPECEGEKCEQERYDLELDPYCVDVNGEASLAWEIVNPNSFSVHAEWSLDGVPGSGTLAPGSTFIGYTPDGPSSHTLDVSWEFGEVSLTSSELCAPVNETPPDGTPPVITVIENLLIPVTGADLGIQGLLPLAGSLVLGIGLLVRGIYGKKK